MLYNHNITTESLYEVIGSLINAVTMWDYYASKDPDYPMEAWVIKAKNALRLIDTPYYRKYDLYLDRPMKIYKTIVTPETIDYAKRHGF